jgi:hypothetical protein
LGDVGRDAVIAHAVVRQIVRVAVVGFGSLSFNAGLLKADERACGYVLVTPVLWTRLVGVGVNMCVLHVRLVESGTTCGSIWYG